MVPNVLGVVHMVWIVVLLDHMIKYPMVIKMYPMSECLFTFMTIKSKIQPPIKEFEWYDLCYNNGNG